MVRASGMYLWTILVVTTAGKFLNTCASSNFPRKVLLHGFRIIICSVTYLLTYLFTSLLTPCNTVLLQKLTGSQLVKKLPAFYGTPRFITTFTSAIRMSLSRASSIQSISPHPTSWRSIPILSFIYAWVSQFVSFPQVSPPKPSPCRVHWHFIFLFFRDAASPNGPRPPRLEVSRSHTVRHKQTW